MKRTTPGGIEFEDFDPEATAPLEPAHRVVVMIGDEIVYESGPELVTAERKVVAFYVVRSEKK